MASLDNPDADHSMLRKQRIALARPVDNAQVITQTLDTSFDLDKTIFKTLDSSVKILFQRTKLDAHLEFHAGAAADIETSYAALPPAPAYSNNEAIFRFMLDECDFATEHADGSFLDHLHFCREYTARHYPAGKPNVMLLHSIMGVGTNCFPMTIDKLPALRKLVPPDEMVQIEAFPSVLRLLVHGPLRQQLLACDAAQLASLSSLSYHRLLDNEPLRLTADELWEQLNYQLIHAIDFLPPSAWQRTKSCDYFFEIFDALHQILAKAGRLDANVGWEGEKDMLPMQPGARPNTWRHWIVDMIPQKIVLKLASKGIADFSAKVGHSLEYSLSFDGAVVGGPPSAAPEGSMASPADRPAGKL